MLIVPTWLWALSAGFLVLGLLLILLGAHKGDASFVGKIAANAGLAVLTGSIIAVPIFVATQSIEDNRIAEARRLEDQHSSDAIRRDNIRLVREIATQPVVLLKPFGELDLRQAQLSKLDLSGADLHGADLRRAYMFDANLSGANIVYARLSKANLHATNMHGAQLIHANLRGARLDGAVLAEANLTDADLTNVTYDSATVWPDGFTPPSSAIGPHE
jgi:uncharacterized protein YjbI with pentapeptide repeats